MEQTRNDLEFELNDKKVELEELKERVTDLMVQLRQTEGVMEK